MSKADEVAAELGSDGPLAIDDYDANRKGEDFEGKPRRRFSIREAVKRILFEITLWLPTLSGAELRAREPGHHETTAGHARDAASWGQDNNLKGTDIQVKLDKVLRNQKRIGDALKIEGIE